MKIFEDIKDGVLPEENMVFYLLENKIVDKKNKKEIEKYIQILSNSFENSTTEERVLLNRVLFILESLIENKEALNNFIYRALRLDFHKTDENYNNFFTNFISKLDEDRVIKSLNERIPILIELDKKELRSFFNWILHNIWQIQQYHNHKKFTIFYNNLKQLIYQLRDKNRIDEMMYVEFFTYHIMGNNFQNIEEWREFNKNVTKETIKGYKQFISTLPQANPSKKIKKRIAFVKDRIVFNSPYQVEYSIFKNLIDNEEFRKDYEIYLYTFNQFEKSFDDDNLITELETLGIKVRRVVDYFIQDGYYYNHLDKALTLRQNIIEDNIDIMIALSGSFPIVNFLFVTRTTPFQIYYSHGNCAYDVEGIDKRISHFNQECEEFDWNLINLPMAKEFLIGPEGEKVVGEIIKNNYKEKFGKNLVILGTIGRLIKLDSDEYIKSISKIMKKNPNTIYLACGVGNEESIKEKLKKYNIDEKRFIFTGMVKPHVYGWVIDIWPDTFPLRGGSAVAEYISKGNGVFISHFKYLISKEMFKKIKKKDSLYPIAMDTQEYIKLISTYIEDEDIRKKYALQKQQELFDVYEENKKRMIKEFLKVLEGWRWNLK